MRIRIYSPEIFGFNKKVKTEQDQIKELETRILDTIIKGDEKEALRLQWELLFLRGEGN